MAKRPSRSSRSSRRPASSISVRRTPSGNGFVLVHPKAVLERSEDMDEVRAMVADGELDVAIDELRWLLESCTEMIEAHFLLGRLAVEADNDVSLARGHFGFGYSLGMKAVRRAKYPKPMPPLHPANRAFFDAGRGLAWCLHQLDKTPMAEEVLEQLLKLDPDDALGLAHWLDEIRSQGTPLVELTQLFGHKS